MAIRKEANIIFFLFNNNKKLLHQILFYYVNFHLLLLYNLWFYNIQIIIVINWILIENKNSFEGERKRKKLIRFSRYSHHIRFMLMKSQFSQIGSSCVCFCINIKQGRFKLQSLIEIDYFHLLWFILKWLN